ncbi:unnamed protein product, partial [Coregonus sp. 'balchen']
MGNTATKFRKALINGDEGLAYQLYEGSPQFKESLDPNTSYGEPYQHNTPLHYATRHAMTRIIRSFLFSKDGNPNKRNAHNETSLHLLCMGPQILMGEGALQPRLARPELDEMKRAECLQIILKWTGAKLDQGEYENADVNATDNKKNTSLHYAAASGMKKCVEILVKREADLFAENETWTPWTGRASTQLALSLESQMVFSLAKGIEASTLALITEDLASGDIEAEYADLEHRDTGTERSCWRPGCLILRSAASGLGSTCPVLPLVGTTPGTPCPPLCGICMCPMSIFEEPVDMFLNLKIQEGEAHNIFCPAYDCFQLVPVEAFVENNPAIRWCPKAGCERAVRLSSQGPGSSSSDPFSQPLLRAPAVDWSAREKPMNHCKYDFCWICLEEWKKHSSSTGGYYRCTRYEVINQVEEQKKDMTVEAEKKHNSFQELDRFMHYYTRFKNHEHSYQLEQRLLKTAKDKMEQLSRALSGREGGPPDTTFIEDAVLELLKTRRILKCSYPYGFFLETKSTKKEIFELMQTDLEMVTEDLAQKVNRPYLRTPRHKIIRAACLVQQKRQEFLASVARGVAPSDSPEAPRRSFGGGTWDWEYLGFASPEEYAEFQYRRRHRDRQQRRQRGDIPDLDEPSDSTLNTQEIGGGRRHGPPMGLGSLDEDDPNILLAIQLSLQESGLAMGGDTPDFLSNEASLGAIGTSLPSRLDAGPQGVEVGPRGAISSSELLELGDSLMRLGNMRTISSQHQYEGSPGVQAPHQHYSNHNLNPFREPSSGGALFSSSSDTTDSTTTTSTGLQDPSHPNTNLLGNIMAWFHDMNPQSITLIPSTTTTTSSDTDLDFNTAAQTTASTNLHQPHAKPQGGEGELGEDGDCFPFLSQGLEEMEAERERPTQLDLVVGLEAMAPPCMVTSGTGDRGGERLGGGNVVHVDTPMCDSVTSDLLPSTSSSEWEEQIHLV